ncbi:MAG: hypothetical protein V4676_10440 [Bacteroidota bacterium]
MKSLLPAVIFFFTSAFAQAQDAPVNSLPAGKYETVLKTSGTKWVKGDIELVDENHYRLSSANEMGEYRFSATAQRIFFTSGPIKGAFAKTVRNGNQVAILLPLAENQQLGQQLASADIIGSFKN